jgi:flagellar hook-associated protein 1
MSFVGLYTGLSGVRAAQTGIDTTSNNVANAATPGYTRQRVELRPSHSYQTPFGGVGTGVTIDTIARLRDGFLDDRYRAAAGDHTAHSVRAGLLTSTERLTGEPENGIANKLSRLWEAAETWSNDPADVSARRQVLGELSSISQTVRSTMDAWASLEADTHARQTALTTSATDTLATLSDLNRMIGGANPAHLGGDTFDQRDRLLDDLARLTGAQVSLDDKGRASVTLGGQQLLGPDGPAALHAQDGEIHIAGPGETFDPQTPGTAAGALRGELGGLRQFLTDDLPRLRGELDDFADTFAAAVNAVNVDAGGGPLLLNGDDGLVTLTGDPADLRTGSATAPHDNTHARQLADLRTTRLGADGTADPAGASLEGRLADMVTGLAGDVRAAKAGADAARSTYRGAELARTSEHGVSIDEEMVGLVRYQRALEANARVMTTVDEALQVLVNRTGIVGR